MRVKEVCDGKVVEKLAPSGLRGQAAVRRLTQATRINTSSEDASGYPPGISPQTYVEMTPAEREACQLELIHRYMASKKN